MSGKQKNNHTKREPLMGTNQQLRIILRMFSLANKDMIKND
jgi:hypothetical protein